MAVFATVEPLQTNMHGLCPKPLGLCVAAAQVLIEEPNQRYETSLARGVRQLF